MVEKETPFSFEPEARRKSPKEYGLEKTRKNGVTKSTYSTASSYIRLVWREKKSGVNGNVPGHAAGIGRRRVRLVTNASRMPPLRKPRYLYNQNQIPQTARHPEEA